MHSGILNIYVTLQPAGSGRGKVETVRAIIIDDGGVEGTARCHRQ